MANAAESTPRGTVIGMESCRTLSPESEAGRTLPRIPSGVAGSATAPCATRDRNGLLSDDERLLLAKIRRNRNQGMLPTLLDCDFMLHVLERMDRC
jgi:hypothetical protein